MINFLLIVSMIYAALVVTAIVVIVWAIFR